MMSTGFIRRMAAAAACSTLMVSMLAVAQTEEKHGRKYKPPPETCRITVMVTKDYNGKPIGNAAVIFHPVKDGIDQGNLEIKTDPEGKASIDVIPVGSTVRVQVIARGYTPYGESFTLDTTSRDIPVKMKSPQEQVSQYQDNHDKPLDRPVGVQTRQPAAVPAPTPATSAPAAMPAPTKQ